MLFAQTPSPLGGPSDWSQFGLIGLVVFALFSMMFLFGGFIVNRFNKLEDARTKADDQRQKFLENCLIEHKSERIEWRDRMDAECAEHSRQLQSLTDKTLLAIDEHTAAFRELRTAIASGKG